MIEKRAEYQQENMLLNTQTQLRIIEFLIIDNKQTEVFIRPHNVLPWEIRIKKMHGNII